jgi:hypothetical protein
MLIDSGADITLVPESSVEQLESLVDRRQTYELKGFDGHRSLASSVELDLVFLKSPLEAVSLWLTRSPVFWDVTC